MFDFNLQEALQATSIDTDLSSFPIHNELDISALAADEAEAHLASAIDSVTSDPESIVHSAPATFDVFCSVLKHAESPAVTGSTYTKLLDVIVSGLSHHTMSVLQMTTHGFREDDMDAPMVHKQPLEMWAFLMRWFVTAADKAEKRAQSEQRATGKTQKGKKGRSGGSSAFSWPDHIPFLLSGMLKALETLPTARLWRTTSEKETFISCFTRSVYELCESESNLKSVDIRLPIYQVLCVCIKKHGHAFGAQIKIVQNLVNYDHLSEPMAELLTALERDYDMSHVGEEVLREVSAKTFLPNDSKGPKSFSRFLVKLVELCPKMVQKQMPILVAHLDSDAHPMRIAIIEIIGVLIRDLTASEEGDEDQRKKQIKRYYEQLMERFLDLNSFVRAALLKTLIKLSECHIFPKQRAQITELAIRTLEDKTSTARRYAIQLLAKLIERHPFAIHPAGLSGQLDLEAFEAEYENMCQSLQYIDAAELAQARKDAGMPDVDEEDEDEDGETQKDGDGDATMAQETAQTSIVKQEPATGEEDETATPRPKQKKRPRVSAADIAAVAADPNPSAIDVQQVHAMRAAKMYYADAIRFITQLESATPTLCQLLVSKAKTEVHEAIRYFRIAYEYKLNSAEKGIKTMLHLIWTKDDTAPAAATTGGQTGQSVQQAEETESKGIRATLIETYRALYFDPDVRLEPRQQVKEIARNMIERTYGATLAELTSLEELVRTTMHDGHVKDDVVDWLWQVYSTNKDIPRPQRQGAIMILGMLALAKREVVTEGVDALLRIGLGPLGMADLTLARYTCIALQRLGGSAKKVKGSLTDKTMRLPMDNPIFVKLGEMIEHAPRSPLWFGMAEQAINTIYLLGEQPDQLCSALIKSLTARVFNQPSSSSGPAGDTQVEAGDEDMPEATQTQTVNSSPAKEGDADDRGGSFPLAQLVFTVGHVAIKHIVYLELVEREFKRRKEETAKEKSAVKKEDGNDLDAVAGNAEDDIGDLITGIREKELLYGEKSLLAVYGPMIAHICASPKRYRSHALRQAATLALTKLMCVSAQYCEAHLLLLFKILETSKDPIVRSNIVIALGDIAVCWGSMIDDNSERLYQGLADSSLIVKKNTLMVLTHLILNGMIKVKGQLGEMAKCLEDPDTRVSDLAKLFFTELSTKDNALYNNLQDVISHLSVGKHAVDEETFERTMRFIFTFIEKDKQTEQLVEKLCQRFRLASEERQWRDISFCLSLLPFKSDRSLKKLIEGLPFYQDKLHEETVYRRFEEILSKARSNKAANKPETELKEFEAILKEHNAKGVEEQALEADVARKTKAAKKRATKRAQAAPKAAPRRGGRRKALDSDDDDDDDDYE